MQLFALLFLALSLLWQIRHIPKFTQLSLSDENMQLTNLKGEVLEGRVLGSTVVSEYAIFLHLENPLRSHKKVVLLCSDMLSKQDFRRLRVALNLL